MTEHSERNVTDALLSWQFFWPEMLQNVCTFCWNCDKCCINNSWKDADKASWSLYLYWADLTKIFIDFVVDLLSSEGCMNLLIITDCLSKRVILKLCKNMTAEWVTQTFVQHFYELMSFYTIVSNWGTQFVSSLWKRVCQLLKIVWRMFTAYHWKLTEQLSKWIRMLSCTFVCSSIIVRTTEQACFSWLS
jgi:hypothetical protein